MNAHLELLRRLRDDPDAFEAFYLRHVADVTRFAACRCESAGDVADVVSATFLAVIDAGPSYDPTRGQPRAWLLGIANHQVRSLRRREAKERRKTRRIAARDLLDDDDITRLDAQIDAERLAPAVARALARAPRSEREMFLLTARDDLSPSEAARVLGISAVAARVRLSRARRRIQNATDAHLGAAAETSTTIAKERP